jgi:hypothetical protein
MCGSVAHYGAIELSALFDAGGGFGGGPLIRRKHSNKELNSSTGARANRVQQRLTKLSESVGHPVPDLQAEFQPHLQ